MKIYLLLGILLITGMLSKAGNGTTTIPTPKHVYVSIGHLPDLAHDTENNLYLAVFICRDKKGDKIMVGINIKELQDIWTQLNMTQIKYENINSGD